MIFFGDFSTIFINNTTDEWVRHNDVSQDDDALGIIYSIICINKRARVDNVTQNNSKTIIFFLRIY